MNKFVRISLVSMVAASLSGCAAFLYSDHNRDASAATPMKSNAPYLTASQTFVLTGKDDFLTFLLFELTPLGIISVAPIFNYPSRALHYSQTVTLQVDPPEAAKKTGMTHEFHVEPGQSEEWSLDFNKDARQELKDTGRATYFEPRNVKITVSCDKRSCSVTVDPPIIAPDGALHLESMHFEDKVHLKKIADAERQRIAEAKQKQKEEQRKLEWVGKEEAAITAIKNCPLKYRPLGNAGVIGISETLELKRGIPNTIEKSIANYNLIMISIEMEMLKNGFTNKEDILNNHRLQWSASEIDGPLYQVTCISPSQMDGGRDSQYVFEVNLMKKTMKPMTLGTWGLINPKTAYDWERNWEKDHSATGMDFDVSSMAPKYPLM